MAALDEAQNQQWNVFDQFAAEAMIMDEDSARQSASISEWKAAGNLTKRSSAMDIYSLPLSNYTSSQPERDQRGNHGSAADGSLEEKARLMRMQRKSASRKKWDKPATSTDRNMAQDSPSFI